MKKARAWAPWICACWLAIGAASMACNVPVFRYALERWHPEDYEAVVFFEESLTSSEEAIVHVLDPAHAREPLNLRLRLVDTAESLDESTRSLWQRQTNAELPWLVLRGPNSDADAPPLWSGPLADVNAERLADSPARREIGQRLMKGQTAVWIFLEGQSAAQDEATLDLLAEQLRKQEKAFKLPPPAPDDPPMHASLPLRVEFSLVRVARNNPAEHFLLLALFQGDADLANATRPIVFPVFGRGRVLAALTGKQLTAETIEEACAFLCGPCSCEMKELNPGTDLLLAAHWDSALQEQATPPPEVPLLAGITQFAAAATPSPSTNTPALAAAAPRQRNMLVRNLVLGFGLVLGALVIGTLALRWRSGRAPRRHDP